MTMLVTFPGEYKIFRCAPVRIAVQSGTPARFNLFDMLAAIESRSDLFYINPTREPRCPSVTLLPYDSSRMSFAL